MPLCAGVGKAKFDPASGGIKIGGVKFLPPRAGSYSAHPKHIFTHFLIRGVKSRATWLEIFWVDGRSLDSIYGPYQKGGY